MSLQQNRTSMTGPPDRVTSTRGIRDRAKKLTTALAAGALVIVGLSALPEYAYPAAVQPQDALTLVRQALAALEVTPPAVSVALQKIIYALLSRDTRGVDMERVQEAARALGALDTAGAAAELTDALRPSGIAPAGVDMSLLTPIQPRFTGTLTAYVLLMAAAALVGAGGFVSRR